MEHSPFSERRLIHFARTLASFGLSNTQKVTTRAAEDISKEQDRKYQVAMEDKQIADAKRVQDDLASGKTKLQEGERAYTSSVPTAVITDQLDEQGNPMVRRVEATPASRTPGKTIYSKLGGAPAATPEKGNIEKGRDLRLAGREAKTDANGNVIDAGAGVLEGTGEAAPVATQEQIQQNQQNLKGVADVGFGVTPAQRKQAADLQREIDALNEESNGPITSAGVTESPADFQARMASKEAIKTEKMKQLNELQMQMQESKKNASPGLAMTPAPVAPEAAPGDMSVPSPSDQGGLSETEKMLAQILQENPDLAAAYLPQLESILSAESTVKDVYQKELQTIGTTDPNQYVDRQNAEKQAFQDKLQFNAEVDALARDRAAETERKMLQENTRAEAMETAQYAKQELDQIRKNNEDAIKVRRSINKLGGSNDYSGLHYVRTEIQAGLDALDFVRTKASIMHGSYGDKAVNIINAYTLDMRQADIDKKKDYSDAYDTYTSALAEIDKDKTADVNEKRKERLAAHKNYAANLIKLDFKAGDMYKEIRLKQLDNLAAIQKQQSKDEQDAINNAIKMLALSTKKGISINPAALATFEKVIAPNLPTGWLSKTSSGVGGSGIGSNYKMWTPEGLKAAQEYISLNPGKSFLDLVPSDQQWLVPLSSQPLPAGVAGPVNKPGFSVEQHSAAKSTYEKEYQALLNANDPALRAADGKNMSLGQYIDKRSFNFLPPPETGFGSAPRRTDSAATVIPDASTEDTSEDDIIFSGDANSFEF